MKLNRGIKFDEDPEYNKVQDQRIELKADRYKSASEQQLDADIFGPVAGRRKPRGQAPTNNQQTPSKPTPTPTQQKKPEPKTETVADPQPPKTTPTPPTNPTKPTIQKPVTPNIPANKPKEDPPVEERLPNNDRLGHNRPVYIRKLRKIAEDFQYHGSNQRNHSYQDIVRPFDCDRTRVQALERLSEGDSFTDRQFPPNSFSLGKKHWKQNSIWKRASSFCNRPVFGKYIQPNDIQLGQLSCPSFASILSCLSQRQENIKRLTQTQQYNPNGFYYIRLNINSVWRYIAVDDYLPTLNGDNLGLLSFRDSQSDIALSLVEKAYAKAYTGYDVFAKKCPPEHYLRDLTGSRVVRYGLRDGMLEKNLEFSFQQNWTVVAVPNKRIEELGLNPNYNLSIIGISSRGFQLRNSWGTTTERSKINFSKEGIFQLSFQQTQKYLEYILVAQTDDRYHTSTIQSKHQSGFYSSYSFRVKTGGQAIISASQWDHRLFPSETDYAYSPFRLIVDRKNPGESPEYVGGCYTSQGRNLDLLVQLTPGSYTISCIGSWSGSAYDYSVTVFADHAVKFDKNYTESFPNIIMKSLQEVNLNNGKRSAKGHVDEYILYHEPTNLILLTNINISDKPYDYTQDLSKINFSTLNLLNAPNQEENFSAKLEEEVSSIKEEHNSERRWSVHLEPKQAFTWVISTKQPYSPNNLKSWGFK